MSSQTTDVGKLLQGAHDAGLLSQQSLGILSAPDVGNAIQAAIGTPVIGRSRTASLLGLLVDDSGSILFRGNVENVREGHNMVLSDYQEKMGRRNVYVHTRLLNGEIVNDWPLVDDARLLDTGNYQPSQAKGTPLYDQTIIFLGTVAAKIQEFEDRGMVPRGSVLILTDGNDEHSLRRAVDVAPIARDVLATERIVIAAMGIDDGVTDFQAVFMEMGVPSEWIYTPADDPTEIRHSFMDFSKSSAQAVASGKPISQTAGGAFV